MNPRNLLSTVATLIALVAVGITAGAAQAEPQRELVTGEITVEVHAGGTVTGTGINCGIDCYDSRSWYDDEVPPTNRLTATPGTGWAFGGWQGCTSVNGQSNKCDASYSEFGSEPIIAAFYDVMAPSVYLHYPASDQVVGSSMYAGAETGDNDRVARVEYLIDGQVVATSTTGPFDLNIDTSGVSEGAHQFQARAFDPTGNNGITAVRNFVVDHSGPAISLTSPVTATNATHPQFSFDTTSTDVKTIGCLIVRKGDDADYSPCSPNQWFAADTPDEGDWQFGIRATDNVGNITQVVHDFVVDRTAPDAQFTSGPADGSVIKVGNVAYEWNVSDGLPVSQVCSWDNGEEVACDGSASRGLAAGTHSFKVTVSDEAGNSTSISRSVTAKKDGDTTDPDPDPDTSDRTAPVVKIVAPRQTLRSARKALRLKVRCDEACSGKVTVTGAGGIRFGGRVVLNGAGVAKLKLRPTAKVRRKLNRLAMRGRRGAEPRFFNLVAKAGLKDAAGNTGKASLRFKVKA